MNTIIEKVRNLIQDSLCADGRDVFTYDYATQSKVFTLGSSNISSATIVVYKNGTIWAISNYSYSSTTGKLTVTGTLSVGDTLIVEYSYYAKYSDNIIQAYIKGAISYISIGKYRTFAAKSDNVIFPTPTEAEENLIAVVSVILIRGDVVSYRTPDLTIVFEKSDSKENKIAKILKQFSKTYGVLGYVKFDEKIVLDN